MDTQLNYYLEDLKRLDEVTVTELETLAAKFPFDQTIRLLLAEKLSFDDNSKLNANLYSSSLFKTRPIELSDLNKNYINLDKLDLIDIPKTSIQDKQFEIDQLNELEKVYAEEDVFVEGLEPISEMIDDLELSDQLQTNEDMDIQEMDLLGQKDSSFSAITTEKQESVNHLIDLVEEKPLKSNNYKEVLESTNFDNESQKIGYTEWLLLLKPISEVKIIKVKKKKKKDKIKETAKKSILKSDSIVSEPLANILALQGHYLEAKIMYHKLIDLNPEKKDVFKSKILEIDQLIDLSR